MNLISWSNRLIRWSFYLLFILVPLILTPWNYELFEYNKMMLTYGLTVVVVAAWLVKSLAQREFRIAKTPLDMPILLFFFSQLISALFSMDPHVSWFGYYSRFNGGMWSIISYILLYYALVSNWTETFKKTVIKLLKISLATAAVVAGYGVAERLGVDKHLWVQDVQNRVFSTLGQPNWLAAYLVALIPLPMAWAIESLKGKDANNSRGWEKLKPYLWSSFPLCLLLATLYFTVLLFTRSRSGLLGLAVTDVVFWGWLWFKTLEKKTLLTPLLIIHAVFCLIVFFNGSTVETFDKYFTLQGWVNLVSKPKVAATQPQPAAGPLLETGGTESGTIRKYVWQAAVDAWRSSTKTWLIGTGTETFTFAFYQFRPKAHNLTSEWDFLYNKAHNEYLNYLATTGILGLGSYLLFIGTFMWWFIKQTIKSEFLMPDQIPNSKSQLDQLESGSGSQRLVPLALFAGWLSILVTNFFGFSVVIMQLLLFLFPAFILVLVRRENASGPPSYTASLGLRPPLTNIGVWTLVLTAAFLEYSLVKFWTADTQFAAGYHYSQAGQYANAQKPLEGAVALNPKEPFYHDELGTALASLATSALENRDATTAAALAKSSLNESDIALSISPKNVNFWKSRTKIYYAFSNFDPKFNQAAITALQQAQSLSPNDPKIVYNLAILYARQDENEKAIELLKSAIDLKPNYRDGYNALYLFYKLVNQPALATATLQQYLTKVDPNDKDFQQKLAQ